MQLALDTQLDQRLRRWAKGLSIALLVIACAVLLGWQFDLSVLRTFFLPPVAMNPLTAICFVLLGLSLQFSKSPDLRRTAKLFAALVIMAGIARFGDLLFGVSIQADSFLYADKLLKENNGVIPNRMAPVTAISFLLSGIVLGLLQFKTHKYQLIHYIVLVIASMSLLSLLGFLYQVKSFYGVLVHISMAPSTALCFFLFAVVILFSDPSKGVMRELTSVLSGSIMARVLIPVSIIVPAVLGLLLLQGNWAGIYSNEFGTAIYALSIIIIFAALTWYNARLLNKRDLLKKQTENALRDSEQHIQAIFHNAPDAVVVMDSDGIVTKWNPEAEKIFGWNEKETKGQLLSELIIPEQFRTAHTEGLKRFLSTGQTTILGKTVDLWALRKDLSKVDVSLRISPLSLGTKQFFVGFIRDITERKQIEDKLKTFNEELSRQVEEKTSELTEIFERITDGFIALDKDFRFTYVNKKASELTHRDPASLIGKKIWNEFPMAPNSSTYHAFHKAMEDQVFVNNTDYYDPLDLWQSNYIYPSANGLSIFIRDISEQKKAETEISKARDLANKLIDSLPGVFYFFDAAGKFIRWNKEFERATGYSAEEIAKMHPIDFFAADEKAYIAKRIEGVFSDGINDAEASFLTRDGKRIPYYFKAVLINFDGKPCLLGNGIDIAERKRAELEVIESEQKYKLLFESNPLPMWMLNLPAYNVIDVNNAALFQYGYSREEFLSLSVYDFRPKEDIEKFKATTNTAFRDIHYAGVWRHKRKNGTILYVDIVTYDLRHKGQETRLVLANDVTEKHTAEEKLKESYEAIRKLTGHLQNIREEERLHISREIHDELGQLLTVLKMDVSWLNKKIEPDNVIAKEKVAEILGVIDTTVKTVRRIAAELRPGLLDDLGLPAAMEWHMEEFERRSGILKELYIPEIEMRLSGSMKIGIFRIFQESLTNVARHSEATKVAVSLVENEKQLILTIKDNGKGFEEKRSIKKTLGLLGMKERSQMMGGQYSIAGVKGEGTTVTVIIPLPQTDL
jgi:PAS domain S-box-containing protein